MLVHFDRNLYSYKTETCIFCKIVLMCSEICISRSSILNRAKTEFRYNANQTRL